MVFIRSDADVIVDGDGPTIDFDHGTPRTMNLDSH